MTDEELDAIEAVWAPTVPPVTKLVAEVRRLREALRLADVTGDDYEAMARAEARMHEAWQHERARTDRLAAGLRALVAKVARGDDDISRVDTFWLERAEALLREEG